MADFKIRAMIDFALATVSNFSEEAITQVLKAVDAETNVPTLAKVATVFLDNVTRVHTLAGVPILLLDWAMASQAVGDMALFNLTGTLIPEKSQLPDPQLLRQERERLWKSRHDGEIRLGIANQGRIVDIKPDYAATEDIAYLISEPGWEKLASGIQSLYASLVILVYTAFEGLCCDLWKTVVNSRPKTLAKYALESRLDQKKGKQNQQESMLPYSEISAYDFNISAAMGTILIERGNMKFDSFFDIQDAYLRTFRLKEDRKLRPSNRLTQLFSSAERDIRSLEKIRNLLVHQGGIVDKKFIDFLGSTSIQLTGFTEGQRLHIDGSMIATYAGTTLAFSKSLLMFVDDWIFKNKE